MLQPSHAPLRVQHDALEHQGYHTSTIQFVFLSFVATQSHVSGALLCLHAFSLGVQAVRMRIRAGQGQDEG